MEASAKVSFIRIAPRKMGLLADEIRGKSVNNALVYLRMSPRKRTSGILSTVLKSAVANVVNKSKGAVDVDNLMVRTVLVGQGSTLKRFRPRAKGSAYRINKKTSHVTLVVSEK